MAMITIDGVALPPPSKFDWGLMDISKAESGRNDKGTMIKARVVQKRKIGLQWLMKQPEEASAILKALNPEYFDATFYDAMEGKEITLKMYASDRAAPVKFWWDGHKYYGSIDVDIIEV